MKIKQIRTGFNYNWKEFPDLELTDDFELCDNVIVLDSNKTYQSIIGFGGAVTEAAVSTILEATKEQQDEILNMYYSKSGLDYNIGRLHIASCDFSLSNYEYLESSDLSTFDMSHEDKNLIPMLNRIDKIHNEKINYLVSPWSPPAFMKSNKERNYGGKLLKEYYDLYSKYLIKYLDEMKKRDILVFAMTVQNEPAAIQTWDSCIYSASEERDFIKYNLGPKLSEKYPDVKLLAWDHNRGDVLVNRAFEIFSDSEASKYIYGIANHWYVSEDFSSLSKFHKLYPDKGIIFTEGCVEYSLHKDSTNFENAFIYARNIIGDMLNYSEGFIDWNIVLNEQGGPNHVNNFCEAPLMYDRVNKKIIINKSYYFIGHFSKYVMPGAKRIETINFCNNKNLYGIGFLNPNGQKIIVLLNQGYITDVNLVVNNKGIKLRIPNNHFSKLLF